MSIDYVKAQRQFRAQKSALTKAINSKDPANVIAATTKAVQQWDETGTWPDAWSRWDRALSDAYNWARTAFVEGRGPRPIAADYDLEEIRRTY